MQIALSNEVSPDELPNTIHATMSPKEWKNLQWYLDITDSNPDRKRGEPGHRMMRPDVYTLREDVLLFVAQAGDVDNDVMSKIYEQLEKDPSIGIRVTVSSNHKFKLGRFRIGRTQFFSIRVAPSLTPTQVDQPRI